MLLLKRLTQVCFVSSDTHMQTLGGLLWPQMKPRQRLKMFIDVQSVRTTTRRKKKKIFNRALLQVWKTSNSVYNLDLKHFFWSDWCDLCMMLHHLLFHAILKFCMFSTYKVPSRYEELLRSVYSKETMHAIGGGLGYWGRSYRAKGLYVMISHFMCTI